jgi:HD-GYP domain-containing protein (c-di-GMP phosphodiesterase class II)
MGMRALRWQMRTYVLTVIAAGAATPLVAATITVARATDELWLTVLLLAATAFAQIRPVYLGPKLKLTVEDAATYAAALTLHPLGAVAVAGLGTLFGLRFARKSSWYNRGFNVAVVVLGTGAAALVYGGLDRGLGDIDAFAAVAAMVAKFLVENVLVDVAVALQLQRSPLTAWWQTHRDAIPHHVALYIIGFLATVALRGQLWALVLFLAPVGIVYLALRDVGRMRQQTRDSIVALADMIDLRDAYTHGHSERVADYARQLARELRLSSGETELIHEAARVHDIGKIGTADQFLLKPGPLDEGETREMRRHAQLGYKLLKRIPEFAAGAELVLSHHERVDGTGYPRGLRGEELPIEARVIAVADAYDAMTTDRPYRRAMSWESTRAELLAGAGTQWDARVIEAFIAMVERQRATERVALEPARA